MIFRFAKSIVRSISDRINSTRDPISFARALGVQVGEGVRFYGINRGMFGSEPWMIKIGNDVHITAGVTFVTHDGGTLILRKEVPSLEWSAPIQIGDDVYIGIQTIILPGVKIGNRSIVGAGSILTKDVPEGHVVAGVPARIICTTDEYKDRMALKSLKIGHLSGSTKDSALRKIFLSRGWFD